ncbi:hypothetical protein ATZ33_08270 [Enterococcus silesiacus]|uniref:WxL domain cell surface protein n=1 Tax=Enterococcus silesiacus TaxID=332949 RepID=A0A0S3KAL5_9ENTE|nr:WxL domain-containing protein [Enterococcus silesiacus]ALS01361.1 hypothetical protein ATZ33_08270 [Enterococcus silesiacus]OJG88592.1 WxL domain cell surface protein [Enterococcus silesiacus]
MKKIKFLRAGLVIGGITTVLLLDSKTISAQEVDYSSNGLVEFTPNNNPTDPVNPNNPDPNKPVKPTDPITKLPTKKGTSGPLSIDFASSLDFGKQEITSKEMTYYANPQTYGDSKDKTANYIQVTDNRGSATGWKLAVKQNTQFQTTDNAKKELTGAKLTINNTVADSIAKTKINTPKTETVITLIPTEASLIMTASKGQGMGTWVGRFGALQTLKENDQENVKNIDVQLTVPGATEKSSARYQTTLNWSLSDTPEGK